MDKVLDYLTLHRVRFDTLSLRMRVVLSQLPLSITMLFLLAGSIVLHAPLVQDPLFLLSMACNAVLLLACFLVPWEKLPYPSFLAIPLLDFVPIGLLREGAGTHLTGLGLLAAFPVIWLAASGQLPRFSVIAGALASLAMVWIPVLASGEPVTVDTLTQPLLVPFMMLAIGITIRVMTASMMAQQAALETKDAELRELLEASGRRERLLRTVVNTVDVGVLALDPAGRSVLANRPLEQMRRVATPEGTDKAPLKDLLLYRMDGVTPIAEPDLPVARAARGETFSEYLVRAGRTGQQRVLSTSARTMKDNEGKREGSVLAFSDVTELAEALNAKDDFLSSVSHELRTPLTSIRGYTELLLLDTNLPPQVTAGLTVIDRNADQLLKLVTDLLGTATGFADLQPVEADLANLLKQAATAAEPRAAASGVVLSLDAPEPLMVECDPARIRQVLDNLLSNAVKYSPDGGTVTVRGGVRDGVVYGEVADTGMGMATEESGSIFTKFFRTSTARMSSIPGVGLGLPLSKDIVERHGGSIWCTSAPGAGSVFTFTLPRRTDGGMPGGTAGGNQ